MKQYIWFDGKFVDFEKATVHVLTHSLQYGSGIFEGIRAYSTDKGPAIFRFKEHIDRFFNSAKIYSIKLPFDKNKISNAIIETLKKNKLEEAYIRPFAFYNDANIGLDVTGKKVSVIVATMQLETYFKNKEKGISCKVSSWHRINSLILPPFAKASGNYINSIIASLEAKDSGAEEAILTSTQGYVAEGAAENIFMVKDNCLITPPEEADILLGITRNSVIKIAENLGIEVTERNIHKEELYTCDELFFAGTAAEITPITKVDGKIVGSGSIGPITKIISDKYFDIVHGRDALFKDWLSLCK
ncbi:MAG: branched-chain amino acid transaminase [Candidatus Micrarchaeia archaeon]